MVKLLEWVTKYPKLVIKYLKDDYRQERFNFIRKMFECPSRWKSYKTEYGYVRGLTYYDVYKEINDKLRKTGYPEVVAIFQELKVRQIIARVGVDKDQGRGTVYTPLVWY